MNGKKMSKLFLPSYIFAELLLLGFTLMGFAWESKFGWYSLAVVIFFGVYAPVRFLMLKKKGYLEKRYPSEYAQTKLLVAQPLIIGIYVVFLLFGTYHNIFGLEFLIGIVSILILCLLPYGYILYKLYSKK